MTDDQLRTRRRSRVIQPEEGPSHWQPVPANGFVEVKLEQSGENGGHPFDSGVQVVPRGGYVREHAHPAEEELIFVYEGEGLAIVDGAEHPMVPGTLLHLVPGSRHKFFNVASDPLRFLWVLMPGGLAEFFRAIGRPRHPGEPEPPPFPRPDDVDAIERATVFQKPD